MSKKLVHWCYIFLTTKEIEMILGNLLLWCISSSVGKIKYVILLSSIPKFTHLSTWSLWVPRSTPENVRFERHKLFLWTVFSQCENNKIRKKMPDFRFTSVKTVWKTSYVISIPRCCAAPLFIQTSFRYSARLCHFTFTWKPVQQNFVLNQAWCLRRRILK